MSASSAQEHWPDWVDRGLLSRSEALGHGVVAQDATGRVLAANAHACRILDLTWEQLTGRSSMDPEWRAIDVEGVELPGDKHPVMVCLAEARDVLGFVMGVEGGSGMLTWLRVDARYRKVEGQGFVEAVMVDVTETEIGTKADENLQEVFRLITERSVDMICRHWPTGEYLYVTPSSERLIGYRPQELVGRNPYDLYHPDDIPQIAASHAAQVDQPSTTVRYRIRHKDGHYIFVETVSSGVLDESGKLLEIQTSTRDLTEQERLQDQIIELERVRTELNLQTRRLQDVLEVLPEATLLVNADDVVVDSNARASRLFGGACEGKHLYEILPASSNATTQRHRVRDRWVESRTSRTGETTIWMLVDVTDSIRETERIARAAAVDTLTGLLTRPALEGRLAERITAGQSVAAIFVDLDDFKDINDEYGHRHGDAVLKHTAWILQQHFRPSDLVARWGGDEFLIVTDANSVTALQRRAANLIARLGESVESKDDDQSSQGLTASIGIALLEPGQSIDDLVHAADLAMYEAKKAGKSGFAFA